MKPDTQDAEPKDDQLNRRRVTRTLTFEATPGARLHQIAVNQVKKTKQEPTKVLPTSSLIRVFLRVRPFSEAETIRKVKTCILPSTRPHILCIRPNMPKKHPPQIRDSGRALFKFSTIFDEAASQEAVFEKTGLPLINTLFQGQSAVVFAYGVTCSGKTFTIQGAPHAPGILPRSLDVIINSISKAKGRGLAQDSAVSDEVTQLTDDNQKRRLRNRVTTKGKKVHDANYIEVDPTTDYTIFASYLEVYNDQVYDLFDRSTAESAVEDTCSSDSDPEDSMPLPPTIAEPSLHATRPRRPALKLKERMCKEMCAGGSRDVREVYPDGQKQVRIKSVADIERLLEFGTNNRTVAHTHSNSSSSRSHAIFVITLQQERQIGDKLEHASSKLYIVDLAGSEKVSRMIHSVDRAQESRQINTSLMSLSRCLETLQKNSRCNKKGKEQIVPFRDSKLTRLLQRSLSSGSAVMIATMSPSIIDADETIHTLRNTAIASEVKLKTMTAQRILTAVKKEPQKDRADAKKKGRLPVIKKVGGSANTGPLKKGRILRPKQDTDNVSVQDQLRKETVSLKEQATSLKDQVMALNEHLESALDEQSGLRSQLDQVIGLFNEKVDEVAASNKERDQLFREGERLRDKLAHAEAKARFIEMEVREELVKEVGIISKSMAEPYEAQIRDLRSRLKEKDCISPLITEDHRKKSASKIAKRLARTSCAAFETIARELKGAADEEDDAPDFQTELDDEYLEEDLNLYQE